MRRWNRSSIALALAWLGAAPACTQIAGLDGSYVPAVDAPCQSDTDCAWGVCNGSPGWCTAPCTADAECPAGYCIENAGNATSCFPACSSDSDCGAYGVASLTCQPATTAGGVIASICTR